MTRRAIILFGLAALAALVLAVGAAAYDKPALLNEVSAVYSLGVGEVRCPSIEEWRNDPESWSSYAYTNLLENYAVLSPLVCAGALGVGTAQIPDWQEAFGVIVLVHESFHLRRWRWRRHEGRVECQAMVHFQEAAMRLGASKEHAYELYPYALAMHSNLVRSFPEYRDRKCVLPVWNLPE
jgi:hypothetical protein